MSLPLLHLTLLHGAVLAAHGHGGGGGGLLGTFVHAIVAALGWRAGSSIAHAVGAPVLIVGAVIAGVVYLVRRRRSA